MKTIKQSITLYNSFLSVYIHLTSLAVALNDSKISIKHQNTYTLNVVTGTLSSGISGKQRFGQVQYDLLPHPLLKHNNSHELNRMSSEEFKINVIK